jgi:hypothetical protein
MKATSTILSAVLYPLARNLVSHCTGMVGGDAAEQSVGQITANLSEREVTEGWRRLHNEELRR